MSANAEQLKNLLAWGKSQTEPPVMTDPLFSDLFCTRFVTTEENTMSDSLTTYHASTPMPVSDMERLALAIANSKLFGVQTADQALALMAIAQAEGLHPALAARDYHIIQGRPTLKADAMLARFQAASGNVRWTEYTDQRVTGVFSHPLSPEPVTITWTLEMAAAAKLTGRDVWKAYPRSMLRARVISEGVRTCYPGVAVGMYTPEEAATMPPVEPLPEPKPAEMIGKSGPHYDEFVQKVTDLSTQNGLDSQDLLDWINDRLLEKGKRLDTIPVRDLPRLLKAIPTYAASLKAALAQSEIVPSE